MVLTIKNKKLVKELDAILKKMRGLRENLATFIENLKVTKDHHKLSPEYQKHHIESLIVECANILDNIQKCMDNPEYNHPELGTYKDLLKSGLINNLADAMKYINNKEKYDQRLMLAYAGIGREILSLDEYKRIASGI